MLAILLALLLLGAGFGASRFTKWMASQGDRTVVLMASVAAWTVLFGLLPFVLLAIGAGRVTGGIPMGTIEKIIINLTPFTLILSPFIGFFQGMIVSRPRGQQP
jgi:hypothetical protein